ncbi:hypothetical protein ASD43_01480 [Microbacterium sp. Root553]|nr:hypothetical protein ASD43_01480 [Microbacterium sp. Root553]
MSIATTIATTRRLGDTAPVPFSIRLSDVSSPLIVLRARTTSHSPVIIFGIYSDHSQSWSS